MKKSIHKYFAAALIAGITFSSCQEDELIQERIDDNPIVEDNIEAGDADFSKYVAIGNSLTAGFADGALFPAGQVTAYPTLLANQFTDAGGGEFLFPNIVSGNGFGGLNADGTVRGRSFAVAAAAADPNASLGDIIMVPEGSPLTVSTVPSTSLNNFGVPGIRMVDVPVPGYGNFNGFYGAFQSSPGASVLGDAVAANSSFFSIWLGNNDVLGYAIAGGAFGEDFDPTNSSTLSSLEAFGGSLNAILDGMSANGANGVLINIPPVIVIPFFQFVTNTPNGVNLIPLDAGTASFVNGSYAEYNQGLMAAVQLGVISAQEAGLRTVNFQEGNNPPVIDDEGLTVADISAAFGAPAGSVVLPNIRHVQAGELFPVTAAAVLGQLADPNNPASVIGVGVPLEDRFVLTGAEITALVTRTAQFNGIIAQQAAARTNITMVDLQPAFADLFGLDRATAAGLGLSAAAQDAADGTLGVVTNGFNLVPLSLSIAEVFNSTFSTDLVHPNARGQALIANEIISTINSSFNASIPLVNPLDAPGINVQL